MTKPDLVVVGFSGNALDALSAIEASFRVVAFLDDNAGLHGRDFEGVPVLPVAALGRFPEARVLCLIGSERSYRHRAAIIGRLGLPEARFATVVHPRAEVSRLARIGAGSVLLAGAQVVSNGVVGRHVIVLPQSVVHHDSEVGDFTLVGTGVIVAGHVRVGPGCYLGSGSRLKNGVTVGEGALVGMGANVLRDVPPGATVVGNPARVLR
ncbi:NeuD/PglB/VioB family sugar acetyltransferase [Rubellimicrobium aerolatum]|uniref:NeuD/PglB/VioB family sugar acetyltransferase n=1 Tax=Rubellimicrobium aerolatum TaxID=490979 RepID=A0ABW0SEC0_9RHOB|nr:NeuD/PglB/VioB family sugar acetyltransferase [Rubellimicrobium aerolatum]MBP1806800.1 sugar O-acyltransferase (sialic acid O-acetyltransferase NeuD family) [Rubellimicrobium aerolatum]